jgi:hypothetical protein
MPMHTQNQSCLVKGSSDCIDRATKVAEIAMRSTRELNGAATRLKVLVSSTVNTIKVHPAR